MISVSQKLDRANEETWLQLANLESQMPDNADKIVAAYENVLRHNPSNVTALCEIARVHQKGQNFREAIEYYKRVVFQDNVPGAQPNANGDVWGALGHCYLMVDELKEAYAAYQRALYSSEAAQDARLWYGIGILYDTCGSYDLAEEVFCHVLKIAPELDLKDEVFYRLGVIYKNENKYQKALECFRHLQDAPPAPLTTADILFQIGIVYEFQGEAVNAKDMYERVLKESPKQAKIMTQLGWLYHQEGTPFHNVDTAIEHMKASVEADPSDPQPWYLLGRCYMSKKEYKNAYSAYQQAVYRDEMNPSYWCSIGVLYYQIKQFRDALDAYSRSICLNPAQSEVWYDLGTLYESCKQFSDAFDAYSKVAELDPNNPRILERLTNLKALMKKQEEGGGAPVTAPQQYTTTEPDARAVRPKGPIPPGMPSNGSTLAKLGAAPGVPPFMTDPMGTSSLLSTAASKGVIKDDKKP